MGKPTVTQRFKKRYMTKKKGEDSEIYKGSIYVGGGLPKIYADYRKKIKDTDATKLDDSNKWLLNADKAYEEGNYYLHTYVLNFEKSLINLNLHSEIKNQLRNYSLILNSRIDQILENIKLTEEEKKLFNILGQDNLIMQLFHNIKNKSNKIKSILSKRQNNVNNMTNQNIPKDKQKNLHFSQKSYIDIRNQAQEQLKKIAKDLENSNFDKRVLEAIFNEQTINQIINSIDIDTAAYLGNTFINKNKPNTKKDTAEGLANFLLISQILNKAADYAGTIKNKDKDNSPNKHYTDAAKMLDFLTMLSNDNYDSFTKVNSKTFAQRFGFEFEIIHAIANNEKVVGNTDSELTSTDVVYTFESAVDRCEKEFMISLKTGNVIYRTQSFEDYFNSLSDNEITKEIESIIHPIKYFYLNFALLMENQIVRSSTRSRGSFKDKTVFSSNTIMAVYNMLLQELGKFYLTNLFVGFILKYWNDKAKNFADLPKAIQYSDGSKIYSTYQLVSALKNSNAIDSNFNIIHADINGELAMSYNDFCLHKSKKIVVMKKNELEGYENLLTGNIESEYKNLSEISKKIRLLTAVDVAVMMEKLSKSKE